MDSSQFEGWPTERLIEHVEQKIASDVPTEYQGELTPALDELKRRTQFFNGNVTARQLAGASGN